MNGTVLHTDNTIINNMFNIELLLINFTNHMQHCDFVVAHLW